MFALLAAAWAICLAVGEPMAGAADLLGKGALFVALLGVVAIALLAALTHNEAGHAQYVLKRRGQQAELLEHALLVARQGRGVALFLRSFSLEDSGASQAEVQGNKNYIADYEWNMKEQTQGHFSGPPPDAERLTTGDNVWTGQVAAIRRLCASIPVVMLENVTTHETKRSELEALRVILVPALTGDWWDVFVQLSEAARFSVFFAESSAPHLRREMIHTAQKVGHPFLLMGDDADYAADDGLRQFLDRKSGTLAKDDLDGLAAWVAKQLDRDVQ